jgi:ABC-type transport system involved in cytochrome c biogenesis permease subunit
MKSDHSLKVLILLCIGITLLGVIFSNEAVVSYFNNNPILNYFLIGVVLLAGVFGAVIFVMGRTGQKLSNIFVIGLVLAIIFIAFGLMKKFI